MSDALTVKTITSMPLMFDLTCLRLLQTLERKGVSIERTAVWFLGRNTKPMFLPLRFRCRFAEFRVKQRKCIVSLNQPLDKHGSHSTRTAINTRSSSEKANGRKPSLDRLRRWRARHLVAEICTAYCSWSSRRLRELWLLPACW